MPDDGVPLSYSIQDPLNFGDLNNVMKSLLFFFTLYLFLYDLTVLASSFKQCEFMDSFMTFGGVCLHLLVIISVLQANDENIQTFEFWSR